MITDPNFTDYFASATGVAFSNGASTNFVAAVTSPIRHFVTGFSAGNSGATAGLVWLLSGSRAIAQLGCPANGGGDSAFFDPPIMVDYGAALSLSAVGAGTFWASVNGFKAKAQF